MQKPLMSQNLSGLELMGLWRGLLDELWHNRRKCVKFDPFWGVQHCACTSKQSRWQGSAG